MSITAEDHGQTTAALAIVDGLRRIVAYRRRGVDLILGGFLHFQEEVEYFGARVLPLVREIEAADNDSARASGAGLGLIAR